MCYTYIVNKVRTKQKHNKEVRMKNPKSPVMIRQLKELGYTEKEFDSLIQEEKFIVYRKLEDIRIGLKAKYGKKYRRMFL